MARGSDNIVPQLIIVEGSAPSVTATGTYPGIPSGDQALFIDSADHTVKLVNHSGTVTPVGSGSLTNASAQLASDVTMTTVDTFYDGPSVSLVAGTWLVTATATFVSAAGGAELVTLKAWDGTTAFASTEGQTAAASAPLSMSLVGVVSPGSTTTYKISAAWHAGATMTMKAATPNNGAGNNATTIVAIKIG
jgi:hypothetical protein